MGVSVGVRVNVGVSVGVDVPVGVMEDVIVTWGVGEPGGVSEIMAGGNCVPPRVDVGDAVGVAVFASRVGEPPRFGARDNNTMPDR